MGVKKQVCKTCACWENRKNIRPDMRCCTYLSFNQNHVQTEGGLVFTVGHFGCNDYAPAEKGDKT
jgi:hypothetical protein